MVFVGGDDAAETSGESVGGGARREARRYDIYSSAQLAKDEFAEMGDVAVDISMAMYTYHVLRYMLRTSQRSILVTIGTCYKAGYIHMYWCTSIVTYFAIT